MAARQFDNMYIFAVCDLAGGSASNGRQADQYIPKLVISAIDAIPLFKGLAGASGSSILADVPEHVPEHNTRRRNSSQSPSVFLNSTIITLSSLLHHGYFDRADPTANIT